MTQQVYDIDQEKIEEIAKLIKPRVSTVGLGGAGCNVVTWIKQKGMVGGRLLALNTDANHLAICKADRRILIGEQITHGLGCGGYPEKGEAALRENLQQVIKELSGSNIVF